MGKVYKNQTKVRIWVDTEQDHSDALVKKIKYQKPISKTIDYVNAQWDATKQMLYYDILKSTFLSEKGTWKFWSWVTFSDKRSAPGEPDTLRIWEEGE